MQIKFNNSVFIGGEKNNVNYFYGIRYAQAKRFDLPKLTDKYPSQVNCLEFGNISHQAPNFFKIPLKESEDCLNLNIWFPKGHEKEKMPVYIYIHGGCFTFGSGSQSVFNGENLSKKGIVVVTINYRLNVFGFFGMKNMKKKINGKFTNTNWGILDQICALKWVKKNIKYFNGDENNITIGGESAGSFSVSCLLMSPLTDPKLLGYKLFNKAILESGDIYALVAFNQGHANTKKTEEIYSQMVDKIANKKFKSDNERLKFMLKADPEIIKKPFTSFTADAFAPSPTFDGVVLPSDVNTALKQKKFRDVDIIWGFNTEEATSWYNDNDKNNTEERFIATAKPSLQNWDLKKYLNTVGYDNSIEKTNPNFWTKQLRMLFEMLLFCGPIASHMVKMQTKNNSLYAYNFNFTSKFSPHAIHTIELKYIFKNGLRNKEDIEISDKMQDLFANFIIKSNPNSKGNYIWEKFNNKKLNCLWIDKKFAMKKIWNEEKIKKIFTYFHK